MTLYRKCDCLKSKKGNIFCQSSRHSFDIKFNGFMSTMVLIKVYVADIKLICYFWLTKVFMTAIISSYNVFWHYNYLFLHNRDTIKSLDVLNVETNFYHVTKLKRWYIISDSKFIITVKLSLIQFKSIQSN